MFYDYVAAQPNVTDEQKRAAEHIDILTFNRIDNFNDLTPYQQNVLQRVLERLTSFEENNADFLECYLNQYNINGVGMTMNGKKWNLTQINGVAIPADMYSLLRTTDLCYPAI